MQKVDLKVEGMTCSNCALTVTKFLEKQSFKNVKVSPISGAVSFDTDNDIVTNELALGIKKLGFKLVGKQDMPYGNATAGTGFLRTVQQKFFFCLPFTLVLMLHMLHAWLPVHWLMNPWLQLALCLPVFAVGMLHFGRSAILSIKGGVPNMDVLITIGALASFGYSLYGAIFSLGANFLFFETTATIITLVFLGNMMEERAVQATQKSLKALVKHEQITANMIAFDDKHEEQVFPVDNKQLKPGDLVLIKTGEQVPADCKILWGEASINESLLTGESIPVSKKAKDHIIGGSVLVDGVLKAQVTAAGDQTVLAGIIKMVSEAQGEKPPVQLLADRISAIFVPVVIVLAIATFCFNLFYLNHTAGESLMRSIAVLVISCPCAMGLATPAAISVGLSRAAKNGILFRNAGTLENFKNIKTIIFDKTGTLTTGKFVLQGFKSFIDEDEFKRIVFSLEKYSSHPIASAVVQAWQTKAPMYFVQVNEIKGSGIKASTANGDVFLLGIKNFAGHQADPGHLFYISKNDECIGWVDAGDELRTEAASTINHFKQLGLHTILLTGDQSRNAEPIGRLLGIDEVVSNQSPAQKLAFVTSQTSKHATAMVGDGINDAPALAEATVGISLSDASQLAMQSADVVLMNQGLQNLPMAMGLGRHTYLTIQQNLFWAFIYNVVAIPVAAFGYLSPAFAALVMGFSDVVLAINSLRLFVKKLF